MIDVLSDEGVFARVKCFVASAFGHDDVDALYDRAIRPVLRELKLQPLRVDRIEHNEDIDDKIFELLNAADICIADLTFARPSVYYEAGFAFASGKPVIYVVRSDHFLAREGDHAGNLRVHFDLQMKNIIPWTSPNKSFKDALRRRLTHAVAPLGRIQTGERLANAAKAEFAGLSPNQQLATVASKAKRMLYSRRFRKTELKNNDIESPQYIRVHRCHKKTYQQVHFVAAPSITKAGLEALCRLFWMTFVSHKEEAKFQNYESNLIIGSLRAARQSSLAQSLPSYAQISNRVFRAHSQATISNKPAVNTIAVIDAINSVDDFADRIRNILRIMGIE